MSSDDDDDDDNVFCVRTDRTRRQQRVTERRRTMQPRICRTLAFTAGTLTPGVMSDEPAKAHAILHTLTTTVDAQRMALTFTAHDALQSAAARQFTTARSDRRYSIVYADPPWGYNDTNHELGTGEQYDVMSCESIAALPVSGLVAADAACLMWTTAPMMEQALRVMRSWGFQYRTVFITWIKVTGFMQEPLYGKGSYTRPNAEFLLLGMRGSLQVSRRAQFGTDSLLIARRPGAHSRKPACVRAAIIEVFGDLPRIELFARESEPGWDAWGNETTHFDDTATTETRAVRPGRRRVNNLSTVSRYTVRQRRRTRPAASVRRQDRGPKSLVLSYYNRPTLCASMGKLEYSLLPAVRECTCECTCVAGANIKSDAPPLTEYIRLARAGEGSISPRHPVYRALTEHQVRGSRDIVRAQQQYNADLLYCVQHNRGDRKRGSRARALVRYSGNVPFDTANCADAPTRRAGPRRINKKRGRTL